LLEWEKNNDGHLSIYQKESRRTAG